MVDLRQAFTRKSNERMRESVITDAKPSSSQYDGARLFDHQSFEGSSGTGLQDSNVVNFGMGGSRQD